MSSNNEETINIELNSTPSGNRVVSVQQGDEIPDAYYSFYQWTPELGAMLVSGIFPSIRNSFPCLDKIDQVLLNFIGVNQRRIKKARHIHNQWCKEFNPSAGVFPRDFLSWFENNPVPQLDFFGNPLKVMPKISAIDVESVGQSEEFGTIKSPKFVEKMLERLQRVNPLSEPILQAMYLAQSTSAAAVFEQLKILADGKKYSLKGVTSNGGEVEFVNNQGGLGRLNMNGLKNKLKTIEKYL